MMEAGQGHWDLVLGTEWVAGLWGGPGSPLASHPLLQHCSRPGATARPPTSTCELCFFYFIIFLICAMEGGMNKIAQV